MTYLQAAIYCTSYLGRELENTPAANWILKWFEARRKKIESKGGDGIPPGAAAVVDLAPRLAVWVASNVQAGAKITVTDLEQMDKDLRVAPPGERVTWLCEP